MKTIYQLAKIARRAKRRPWKYNIHIVEAELEQRNVYGPAKRNVFKRAL